MAAVVVWYKFVGNVAWKWVCYLNAVRWHEGASIYFDAPSCYC